MSNGITAPFFLQHFTDPTTNKPVSGGTVEYYVGGSTNIPKLVYADVELTNSLGNVLTLDAGGYAPQYFMLSGYYKIVLRRANGSLVYTRDYVEGGANSSDGDHKFAINQSDENAGGAGFFQDKVVASVAIEWEVVDIGDGVLQAKANLTDEATAKPIGPAGGDLFGTYPNPRVKELTGVPAMLTPSIAGFNWKPSGGWASGAGIGFGFGYVNGVQTRVWMAISQLGELQVSYDEWKTTVYIPEGMPYRNSFTDNDGNTQLYNDVQSKFAGRYAAVSYLEIPGTGKWCWMFGAQGDLFGLEDTPDNFYANGAPKLENMFAWSYTGYDPNTITSNGTTMVFTGNSNYISYARAANINWTTKSIIARVATIPSNIGVFGGNACDGTKFLAVGRDSGVVVKSDTGVTWVIADVLSTKFQDDTPMIKTSDKESSKALPMHTKAGYYPAWSSNDNAWVGMLFANDMWIVVNGKPAPTSPSDAWSPFLFTYDKSNWNGYKPTPDELAVNYSYSMYKIAYGHGKTFATNSDPFQDYKNQPAIYRLLMDEIPAHRKLVAEKGLDVIGTLALLDLPNCTSLATDKDGNIIAGSSSGGGDFIRNQGENGTNDSPGHIFLAPEGSVGVSESAESTYPSTLMDGDGFRVQNDVVSTKIDLSGMEVHDRIDENGQHAVYGRYSANQLNFTSYLGALSSVTEDIFHFNGYDYNGVNNNYRLYQFDARLKFRIGIADTVPAELEHKIVDSNGAELAKATNGSHGQALVIPTTQIAGTPNGQELFNYSAYELKSAIAQDGSGQGNNYGTRGFAFIALSSRLMTKGRMFVPQTGGQYMRFGIYDNQWKLLAKSARTAIFGGIIPFTLNIGFGGVAVAGAQLIGGERYYMAYWCDDTTSNLKFGCITGRNTDSDDPQPQIFLDNQEMPDKMGTSGYRTALRPWMAVYEA